MNLMSKDSHLYSNTQVASLLEQIRSDFKSVTEVVIPLREDMDEVKKRLTSLENEMRSVKDVIRITLPNHENRISRLEKKVHQQ